EPGAGFGAEFFKVGHHRLRAALWSFRSRLAARPKPVNQDQGRSATKAAAQAAGGDALVARGMAAGSIQTQARGETDLARETRDGVREPLNRRTAVTISFR